MNKSILKAITVFLGFLTTFFSILFLFLPFKVFLNLPAALVTGCIGLGLFVLALNLSVRNNLKRRLPIIGVAISIIIASIAFITIFTASDTVETDVQFESKNEQIKESVEASEDLQEALEEIDESELEELISDELLEDLEGLEDLEDLEE